MTMGLLPLPLMSVKATTELTIPTQLFMTAYPSPIGVNQPITLSPWLGQAPIQAGATLWGWNFTINVVTPDGKNVTLGPFESAPNGGYYTTYTPTTPGNYTFQAFFPKTIVTIPPGSFFIVYPPGTYTWPAAISTAVTVDVQSTAVSAWPQTSLPTSYWENPIFAENQNWYTIAGNWLLGGAGMAGRGSPADYTTGPATAHILWTKPLAFGGISGGQYSTGFTAYGTNKAYTTNDWGVNYYTGLLYQNKLSTIIISGYMYYNTLASGLTSNGINCISLRTGALIWSNPSMPQLTCGEIVTTQGGFGSGSYAYLWASNSSGWYMFDAFTGHLLTTFVNLPTSVGMFGMPSSLSLSPTWGENGELLQYIYNSPAGYFAMWNSTKARAGYLGAGLPYSASPTTDWRNGLQWNVTIPPTVPGAWQSFIDYADGVLVGEAETNAATLNPTHEFYGYSTTTGALLWQTNQTNVGYGEGGPGSNAGVYWYYSTATLFGDGYFAFFQRETMQYHVLSVLTGKVMYVTDPLPTYTGTDLSFYDWADSCQIADGIMFASGYDGSITAWNVSTGVHLWTFKQINAGLQTPYGTWPTFGGSGIVADGKLYFGFTQHTPGTPLFRGYNLYCLNYTTGKEIWEIPGFFPNQGLSIADGELTDYAGYDNQIYAFGQGPSRTSVNAPEVGITTSTPITITGTVMDISAGSQQSAVAANYPNGLPCVSDDSMSLFMEAVYQQQPMPTNITGVPVTISVLDSNHNSRVIGTTTTNVQGVYGLTWTPDIPGNFTVTATFAGTGAYYGSSASTYFYASVAATPTPTAAPITGFATTSDLELGIAAIAIIVIVCVAVLAMLLVRKKP